MQIPALILLITIVVVLIVFLIWKNQKDKDLFIKQQTRDFRNPRDSNSDIEIDEVKK